MATVREVQSQVTRPTSVVIMTLLFEGFQLLFPTAMSTNTVLGTYKVLLALGATGIIDKAIRNRKRYIAVFKSIFTKKEKENG